MRKDEKCDLLGDIIGAKGEQTPKGPLVLRPITVTAHHPSTVMLPGDLRPDPNRWLHPINGKITKQNQARFLVRGEATYRAMQEAIATATGSDHFIFLAGWSVTLDFPLSDTPGAPTMGQLLADRSAKGVKIRGIYWRQADELVNSFKQYGRTGGLISLALGGPPAAISGVAGFAMAAVLDRFGVTSRSILGMEGQNHAEVDFINKLPTGIGILDKHHSAVGCHHQKILLVNGARGLIAFVGGIDVYPDRVWPSGQHGSNSPGAPYEDLHCQIEGEGAFDVLSVFVERWEKCGVPEATAAPTDWMRNATQVQIPPSAPECSVQIGHTHGNPACAPPKQTAKGIILHALGRAQRYIYVEDQYLVNLEAARALHAAVPRVKALTIVIPNWTISDLPQCTYRRRQFIRTIMNGLSPEDAKKVGIYCLKPPGAKFTYVHSKFWIIDDEIAIIGSANCNRRGWESDSEIVAAIVDKVDLRDTELTFAHRLRMEIWARHLRVDRWQVHDPIGSVAYFRQDPLMTNVQPYKPEEYDKFDIENSSAWPSYWKSWMNQGLYDTLWDTAFDPPGTP